MVNKTIEESINENKKKLEKEVDGVLKEVTSSSANTLRSHLKKVVVDEVAFQTIIAAFPGVTSPKVYDEIKKNYARPHKQASIENRFDSIKKGKIDIVKDVAQKYSQHKQLFKKMFHGDEDERFNILEYNDLEDIDDKVCKIVYDAQVLKYAKSFLRSYKNLLNKDSLQLFASIYDGEYDRDYVAKQLKKVASFDSPEHLTNVLTKIIEGEHSAEYIAGKIEREQLNAEILYYEGDEILVNVKDFETSQKLGSSQWCISNRENLFKIYKNTASNYSYVEFEDEPEEDEDEYTSFMMNPEDTRGVEDYHIDAIVPSYQLFHFRFDRPAHHPEYMVGITVSSGFELVAAHDKNDADIVDEIFSEHKELNGRGEMSYWDELLSKISFDNKEHQRNIMEILKKDRMLEEAFSSEWIIGQVRNPLNFLMTKERDYNGLNVSVYEQLIGDPNITGNLIRKSLEDYKYFGDISEEQMFLDLTKAFNISAKVTQTSRKEFIGESPKCIDPRIFWSTCPVNDFIQKIDDKQKEAFVENNPKEMEEFLKQYNNVFYNKKAIPLSEAHCPKINGSSFNSIDKKFTETLLNSEQIDLDYKARIVFEFSKSQQASDNIKNLFTTYIKEGVINPVNVLKDALSFNQQPLEDFIDLINQDPEYYLEPMNNHVVQKISHSQTCLEKLSEATCKVINNNIKKEPETFGSLSDVYEVDKNGCSFGQRMKAIKDKGIVDNDIINQHYDRKNVGINAKADDYLFIEEIPRPSAKSSLKSK